MAVLKSNVDFSSTGGYPAPGYGPHITHVQSGNNRWDPMHQSIFEVLFSAPPAVSGSADYTILTEQIVSVSGLDALQKTSAAGQQKFMGVDVSFLNPVLDNTYADITIVFNLNINDAKDVFVLSTLKEWAKLGYDLGTGARHLMADYCADTLTVNQANRDGQIFRSIEFHKVMLTSLTGIDSLDYGNSDACQLTAVFRCDYWNEYFASASYAETVA